MIDDRASGGRLFESAVVTCSHCQKQVVLNPDRQRPRGYCRRCDHYICDSPACNFECRPINELFDQVQEQAARGADPLTTIAMLRKDILNG